MNKYDLTIIGGGIFGCFAAYYFAKNNPNKKVVILEKNTELMSRASYINQARVHMGYHYPRSMTTALSSSKYFKLFCEEFSFAINKDFEKIYGISNNFSLTNAEMFEIFCQTAKIPIYKINAEDYFNTNFCNYAYKVMEYSFDSNLIKNYFLDFFKDLKNLTIIINNYVTSIKDIENEFEVITSNGEIIRSKKIINATYAATNQVLKSYDDSLFNLKYELCEIILCKSNSKLENKGITVMDGPFFSAMPFGLTGLHSLSAVEYTPHKTSSSKLPIFNCQSKSNSYCSPENLQNCNNCLYRPETNFNFMYKLAKKYLNPECDLEYEKSLFTIKTVPLESELDDSRPTIIRASSKNKNLITVLSGKINTIYDLIEVIDNVK